MNFMTQVKKMFWEYWVWWLMLLYRWCSLKLIWVERVVLPMYTELQSGRILYIRLWEGEWRVSLSKKRTSAILFNDLKLAPTFCLQRVTNLTCSTVNVGKNNIGLLIGSFWDFLGDKCTFCILLKLSPFWRIAVR